MAVARKLDEEKGLLVIQLTEDEQRMVKQTMEDSRLIPTYLRIDKAELTIVNNEAKVKS